MAQRKIQSIQLSDTGVTPGPYTSTNITVDSSGRITSAGNGTSVPALPAARVAYGSPSNVITSIADFTYNDSTGTLSIGTSSADGLVTGYAGRGIVVEGDTGVTLKTGVNTLKLGSLGQILINTNAGTIGQVMTSAGTGAVASWTTPNRDIPRTTLGWTRGYCWDTASNQVINTSDMGEGYSLSLCNSSASPITITPGVGVTLHLSGTVDVGVRTLAPWALATIWCRSTTEAIIIGGGLT